MIPQPQRRIVGIAIAGNFCPLPIAPIYLTRRIMARTPSEEPKTRVSDEEDLVDDLKQWDKNALDIITEIESREHQRRFAEMVKGGSEAKCQVCAPDLAILQHRSPS
jgi:hypothetical protein